MEKNNFINSSANFILKRLAEVAGIFLTILAILLFFSFLSYSPDDPNFIFDQNAVIKNALGIKGSYISDIFFQSIGLISILIPVSIFFTGINIIIEKNFIIL